jgi:hypothetical protein
LNNLRSRVADEVEDAPKEHKAQTGDGGRKSQATHESAATEGRLRQGKIGIGAAGQRGGLPRFGIVVPLFVCPSGWERSTGTVPGELTVKLHVANEQRAQLVFGTQQVLQPAARCGSRSSPSHQ